MGFGFDFFWRLSVLSRLLCSCAGIFSRVKDGSFCVVGLGCGVV